MIKPCGCGDPTCLARTASDYSLNNVDVVYRMFALLHAAGRDLSEFFEMDAYDWGVDASRSRKISSSWRSWTSVDGYDSW